jgi:hypothetical protein
LEPTSRGARSRAPAQNPGAIIRDKVARSRLMLRLGLAKRCGVAALAIVSLAYGRFSNLLHGEVRWFF